MNSFRFTTPLVEGIIEKRKSQFTMTVNYEGQSVACHCPTTGRIGNLDVAGRPCLLSASTDPGRKTPYTVEAISLNKPEDEDKSWIGINQNAANRYVEHYLRNGGFSDMVGTNQDVQREKFLGASKLDFLVGNTYLEVKTPLQHLQVERRRRSLRFLPQIGCSVMYPNWREASRRMNAPSCCVASSMTIPAFRSSSAAQTMMR